MTTFDLFNPTEEHRLLRESVRAFVAKEVEPQAHEYDRKEQFNLPLFKRLGELGLLGITVDPAFEGSGMDAVAAVIAHEELAMSDPGLTLAYLAHAILCVNNFYFNASDEQKKFFLPRLCRGEWVGAMAMSEPDVGTDVLAMGTQARRVGDHYLLNGRKMWITNGALDEEGRPVDCVLVYARTGSDRNHISTFMVTAKDPGFSVGQKIRDKLGMRASNTAELVFSDCKVPLTHRLGEEGDSLHHMMRNLEIERVTLAAMSVGIARRALSIMVNYANERHSFGKALSHFGQIQKYIADSYGELRAVRCYLYETARNLSLTAGDQRLDSDGVKLVAATMAKEVCDRAIQVLGGYGYVGEYHVERLWRDAKLLEIGGGTLEAHQKNMTRDLARNPALVLR